MTETMINIAIEPSGMMIVWCKHKCPNGTIGMRLNEVVICDSCREKFAKIMQKKW